MNLHLASMIAIVGSLEPGERWCVRHAELGRPNTLSEFLAEDRILENIIGSGHTHGYTRNAVHRTTTFYRAREGQVPEAIIPMYRPTTASTSRRCTSMVWTYIDLKCLSQPTRTSL